MGLLRRIAVAAGLRIAVAAGLLLGCGGPHLEDGDVRCGTPPDECPPGFTCAADGFCRGQGGGEPDAAGGSDAPAADASFADDGGGSPDGHPADAAPPGCGNGVPTVGDICYLVGTPLGIGGGSGSNTSAVLLADVTHDDQLDIVATDELAGKLVVRTGDGGGGFSANLISNTDSGPIALAAADFTLDGHVDVVTVQSVASTVRLLPGNDSGSFPVGSGIYFAVSAYPTAAVLARLNTDAAPDLAVVKAGESSIERFMNNGSGTINSIGTIPCDPDALGLAVADLNGTTIGDMVVASSGFDRVQVLLDDGLGGFTTTNYTVGNGPHVAIADLEGDGDLDVFVALDGANGVLVLINNGLGVFTAGPSTTVAAPVGLVTADVDTDGWVDVVTVGSNGHVSVLRGNGTGSFVIVQTYVLASGPRGIASGDVNGDGLADFAVAGGAAGTVTMILSDP